jgi:hypothetical protein
MIFVLSYDRLLEKLLEERQFSDDLLGQARHARVESEARYAGNDDIEVVLLRSATSETLQQTHSRYFCSARQIAATLGDRLSRR